MQYKKYSVDVQKYSSYRTSHVTFSAEVQRKVACLKKIFMHTKNVAFEDRKTLTVRMEVGG
jgi:hypothetical protein